MIVENSNIRFELDCESLFFELTDKRTDTTWKCEEFLRCIYGNSLTIGTQHFQTECTHSQNTITISFLVDRYWARWVGYEYFRPKHGPKVGFDITVIIEDDHIGFRIGRVEGLDNEEFDIIVAPGLTRISSDDSCKMLVPQGCGLLYDFPRSDYYTIESPVNCSTFPMVTYGILKENAGLLGYIKTPFDSLLRLDINSAKKGISSLMTRFQFNSDLANYPRELNFYLLTDGSYVQAAKRYRQIVKAEGRFVDLNEKIAQNPEVEKLVGAVVWKHNVFCNSDSKPRQKDCSLHMPDPKFSTIEDKPANWHATEVFETANKLGFDRVVVYNTGWNYGGFDSHYPTRFPPNEQRGTEEEFSKQAFWARSLSDDYILSVHDNYLDVYENSSEFDPGKLITDKNNLPIKGEIWQGGRAFLMCPSQAMEYVKRDIPRLVKMLGKGSIYIDVMGAVRLTGCCNPEHLLSKTEEANARKEILKYIKNQIGSVATEYIPADYLADTADMGAYFGIHAASVPPTAEPLPKPIPFFQLIYHDCVLNFTSEGTFKFYGSEYLLYVALYGLLPGTLTEVSKKLSVELRDAYKSEMISHEFIEKTEVSRDDDGMFWSSGVQKTEFSDGTTVIANFNNSPYLYCGNEIPARGFIISKKDM